MKLLIYRQLALFPFIILNLVNKVLYFIKMSLKCLLAVILCWLLDKILILFAICFSEARTNMVKQGPCYHCGVRGDKKLLLLVRSSSSHIFNHNHFAGLIISLMN